MRLKPLPPQPEAEDGPGLGIAAMDVASNTLIQRIVPPAMLGRVFGNFYGAIGVAAAASYVGGGILLGATSPRTTFWLAGGAGMLATLLVPIIDEPRACVQCTSVQLGMHWTNACSTSTMAPMPAATTDHIATDVEFDVIDVFTNTPFNGNPAGVVNLEGPADESWMSAVASEIGCPNTAFLYYADTTHHLRWYTGGGTEVRICGHATIAAAHCLRQTGRWVGDCITFHTASGQLTVNEREGNYELNLPVDSPTQQHIPDIELALGTQPLWTGRNSNDSVAILTEQKTLEQLQPDHTRLASLGGRGVIVSAPGTDADYVLRFFGPAVGVNEDNVTGTAHCALAPYWHSQLGQSRFRTTQLSARPGTIIVTLHDTLVTVAGSAVTTIHGRIARPGPPPELR